MSQNQTVSSIINCYKTLQCGSSDEINAANNFLEALRENPESVIYYLEIIHTPGLDNFTYFQCMISLESYIRKYLTSYNQDIIQQIKNAIIFFLTNDFSSDAKKYACGTARKLMKRIGLDNFHDIIDFGFQMLRQDEAQHIGLFLMHHLLKYMTYDFAITNAQIFIDGVIVSLKSSSTNIKLLGMKLLISFLKRAHENELVGNNEEIQKLILSSYNNLLESCIHEYTDQVKTDLITLVEILSDMILLNEHSLDISFGQISKLTISSINDNGFPNEAKLIIIKFISTIISMNETIKDHIVDQINVLDILISHCLDVGIQNYDPIHGQTFLESLMIYEENQSDMLENILQVIFSLYNINFTELDVEDLDKILDGFKLQGLDSIGLTTFYVCLDMFRYLVLAKEMMEQQKDFIVGLIIHVIRQDSISMFYIKALEVIKDISEEIPDFFADRLDDLVNSICNNMNVEDALIALDSILDSSSVSYSDIQNLVTFLISLKCFDRSFVLNCISSAFTNENTIEESFYNDIEQFVLSSIGESPSASFLCFSNICKLSPVPPINSITSVLQIMLQNLESPDMSLVMSICSSIQNIVTRYPFTISPLAGQLATKLIEFCNTGFCGSDCVLISLPALSSLFKTNSEQCMLFLDYITTKTIEFLNSKDDILVNAGLDALCSLSPSIPDIQLDLGVVIATLHNLLQSSTSDENIDRTLICLGDIFANGYSLISNDIAQKAASLLVDILNCNIVALVEDKNIATVFQPSLSYFMKYVILTQVILQFPSDSIIEIMDRLLNLHKNSPSSDYVKTLARMLYFVPNLKLQFGETFVSILSSAIQKYKTGATKNNIMISIAYSALFGPELLVNIIGMIKNYLISVLQRNRNSDIYIIATASVALLCLAASDLGIEKELVDTAVQKLKIEEDDEDPFLVCRAFFKVKEKYGISESIFRISSIVLIASQSCFSVPVQDMKELIMSYARDATLEELRKIFSNKERYIQKFIKEMNLN